MARVPIMLNTTARPKLVTRLTRRVRGSLLI
jgi:hypothetical protein